MSSRPQRIPHRDHCLSGSNELKVNPVCQKIITCVLAIDM